MMKHSAKFQVSLVKDVAGVAGSRYESASAITLSKIGRNKNQEPHAHLHILRRQSIKFQINPMKDVRVAGIRSDGQKDRQNDGRMHTQTEEGHFF